jgi:hypothetical protein
MFDGISRNNESSWNTLQNKQDTQEHGSFLGGGVKPADTSRKTTITDKIIESWKKLKEYNINLASDIVAFLWNTAQRAGLGLYNLFSSEEIPLKIIPRITEHRLKKNLNFTHDIGCGITSRAFLGVFNGKNVIIKQIPKTSISYKKIQEEVSCLFHVKNNPNFVEIVSAYQDKNNYYIIMKDEGRCLLPILIDTLDNGQPMENIKNLGYTVEQLMECLKALIHTRVFCMDFKMYNMVYTSSNIKICDQGYNNQQDPFISYGSPRDQRIINNIAYYEYNIGKFFRCLSEDSIKYTTSALLNKYYSVEERHKIFEKYFKPELDKNNLIAEEQKQRIKQSLYDKVETTKSFIENFLGIVYICFLDSDKSFNKISSYDDTASAMISVINGLQNFIKDELGYVKLKDYSGIKITVQNSMS